MTATTGDDAQFDCEVHPLLRALKGVGIVAEGGGLVTLEADRDTIKVVSEDGPRRAWDRVSSVRQAVGSLTLDYDELLQPVESIAAHHMAADRPSVTLSAVTARLAQLEFGGQIVRLGRSDDVRPALPPNTLVVPRAALASAIPAGFEQASPLPGWRHTLAIDVLAEQVMVYARHAQTTTVTCVPVLRAGFGTRDVELNLAPRDVARFARLRQEETVEIAWTSESEDAKAVSLRCDGFTLVLPSVADNGGLREHAISASESPIIRARVGHDDLLNALRACIRSLAAELDTDPDVLITVDATGLSLRPAFRGPQVGDSVRVNAIVDYLAQPTTLNTSAHALTYALHQIAAREVELWLRVPEGRIAIESADADSPCDQHVVVDGPPPF